VAFRGIDRYFERHDDARQKPDMTRGGRVMRRRPVRIEFCEADILDAFDDWRRAVGVSSQDAEDSDPPSASRKPALAAHVERAAARLRAIHAASVPAGLFPLVETAAHELETLAIEASRARGENRARIIERLAALDRELMAAALAHLDASRTRELEQEAEAELAPFRSRMSSDVRTNAVRAAFHRLVRESAGLPVLVYE
jgi:hypothetical protein